MSDGAPAERGARESGAAPHVARAVLFTWTDIDPAEEPGFNEWYNREHMRDRILGLPGFIRGRRYENTGSEGPKYLAFYEAWDTGVFQSAAYLAMVGDPDPSSRHYILRFRNVIRTIGRIAHATGEAEGACLAVLPLAPAPEAAEPLDRTLAEDVIPDLMRRPGIVAARTIWRDDSLAARSTGGHVRQGDRRLEAGLFVEATHMVPLRAAIAAVRARAPLAGLSTAPLEGPAFLQQLYRVAPV
ncbi:DUF4286 family protein [Aquabacter spiritensis]|uniref:NIPSNAP protein n=1 Tax=Aquabacter spiritensis TaxID=933073 RepID=A0A4R3M4D2_9HYPH|nr:DUF4286 family protein [Aquabacter spiritensis]TCT06227.1 hypothetical protein EDC64_103331 [Aquabacter spiritensis]